MTLKEVLNIILTCYDNHDCSKELIHGFSCLQNSDKKKLINKINMLNTATLVKFLNNTTILSYLSLSKINELLSSFDENMLLLLLFRPSFYQSIINKCNQVEPSIAVCYLKEIYRNNKYLDAFLKLNYTLSYLNSNTLMALAIKSKSKDTIKATLSCNRDNLDLNYLFNILASFIDNQVNEDVKVDYTKRKYILFILSNLCKDDITSIYNFVSRINDSELIIMILKYYKIPFDTLNEKLSRKIINNLRFLSDLNNISPEVLKKIMLNLSNEEIFEYISQPKFMGIVGNKNIIALLKLLPKEYYENYIEVVADNPIFDESLFEECFKYIDPVSRVRLLSYEKVILKVDETYIISCLGKFNENERKRLLKLIMNASRNCLDKQLIILNEYANHFNTNVDDIYSSIMESQNSYPKGLKLEEVIELLNFKYEDQITNAIDDDNYQYLVSYLGKRNIHAEALFFKLLNKDYCDRLISNAYYQIIILRVIHYLTKKNLSSEVKASYAILRKDETGSNTDDGNRFNIELNAQSIGNTFRSNLSLFEACFHEICHCHQVESMKNGMIDLTNIMIAIESVLNKYDQSYQSVSNNYWAYSEVEAFSESIHQLYQILNNYNKDLAEYYFKKVSGLVSVIKHQKENPKRKIADKTKYLDELFEEFINQNILNKSLINQVFSEFPSIKLIYDFNEDGTIKRKGIISLIESILASKGIEQLLFISMYENKLKNAYSTKDKRQLEMIRKEIDDLINYNSLDPNFDIYRTRYIGKYDHNKCTLPSQSIRLAI